MPVSYTHLEEDERIDGLLILINTVGGDVEAGLAIAEVISGMKKPTVSICLLYTSTNLCHVLSCQYHPASNGLCESCECIKEYHAIRNKYF